MVGGALCAAPEVGAPTEAKEEAPRQAHQRPRLYHWLGRGINGIELKVCAICILILVVSWLTIPSRNSPHVQSP